MYRLFQQNKKITLHDLPKDTCLTNFSMFRELETPLVFRSFSIKFVLAGTERYIMNGKEYAVGSGQYLLANSTCEGSLILIDSKETVKGICIDLSSSLFSEVVGSHLAPDTPFSDLALDKFFTGEDFLENKYHAKHTKLGAALTRLGRAFDQNPHGDFQLDQDYYFTLAETLVEDHQPLIGQLHRIQTVKHRTRKELYRRLCCGKEYLDENFAGHISIRDAARHAALSEYHFFRLFKAAFGITPQQYLIRTRLAESFHLLQKGNHSVSEVALATGHSDVFHFSRSFKKQYGVPPSSRALPKLAGFHK